MHAQTIQGSTRLIGLIGNPVGHSLSPQIHNHALKVLGLPFAYVPLGVAAQSLHTAMFALRALSFQARTHYSAQAAVLLTATFFPVINRYGQVNTLYFRRTFYTAPRRFLRVFRGASHGTRSRERPHRYSGKRRNCANPRFRPRTGKDPPKPHPCRPRRREGVHSCRRGYSCEGFPAFYYFPCPVAPAKDVMFADR